MLHAPCSFISWIFWLVMLPLLLTLWLCVCYLIELFIRINRDSLVSHWREKSAKKNFPALLAHQHIYAHDDEFSLLLPKGKSIQVNKLFIFIEPWTPETSLDFLFSQEKIEIGLYLKPKKIHFGKIKCFDWNASNFDAEHRVSLEMGDTLPRVLIQCNRYMAACLQARGLAFISNLTESTES